jgi:hypothetical protein
MKSKSAKNQVDDPYDDLAILAYKKKHDPGNLRHLVGLAFDLAFQHFGVFRESRKMLGWGVESRPMG